MPDISVIIPAYNVEKYLGECIDSVIGQGVDCEIIIVNDGSVDKTLEIANSYAEKYSFISVFSQQNSGQSVARNVGISHATGEYLLLLDSDDYIEDNALEKAYKICKKNDLDYIRAGWRTFYDGTDKSILTIPHIADMNKVISGKEYFVQHVSGGYNVAMETGLIKRDFYIRNGIKYLEGVQYEDNDFALKLFTADLNARAMQVDMLFAHVRISQNTTTSSKPSLKKLQDILVNIDSMNEYIFTLEESIQNVAKKLVSLLVFHMTSVYFKFDRKNRNKADKIIPKSILKEAIKYPYDSFQKKKIWTFTYFRPLLTIYNATIRKVINRKREQKRLNG